MPSLRSALGGFASVGSSTVLVQAIGFVALAVVARRVGPANLGDYNFAITVITCFGLGTVGVGVVAIREIAVDPDRRRAVATETTLALVALDVASLVVVLLVAPLIATSGLTTELLRILALSFLTNALLVEWALIATGHFRWVASGRVAGQIAYAALVFLLLGHGRHGVIQYAAFNLVGYGLTAGISLAVFLALIGFARPAPGVIRRLPARLRQSLPLGLPLGLLQFYLSLNLILLGYIGTPAQTGQYAVASRLPSALVLLGMVWGSVLYPHVARADRADLADLARDLGRATTFTLGAGALLVTGAAVFAVPLMTALFGGAYRSAGAPFAVLAAAAILLIADATLGSTLLARGGERPYAAAVCLGLVATAALGALLIPFGGAVGAAAATLAAETGIFVFYVNRAAREVGRIPIAWSLVGRCAATCIAGLGAVLLVDPGPLPARAGLFAAAILACALLVGLGRPPVWRAAWRGS